MKVSIGSKIVKGPWGGGNLFAINLSKFLLKNNNQVIYDLTKSDIDVILLTDPRSRGESSSTFNHEDIYKYKKYVNENVVVVQRINECDERKGTDNINNFYLNASKVADHVVFVSTWLRDLYVEIGMDKEKTSVILAGANKEIFNDLNTKPWTGNFPIKLVTHHWSNHDNKGFEIYKKIDDMLADPKWKNKIQFTYIGNLNPNFKFLNTRVVSPLAGKELANELKSHNIYVTASINEPSGNHHIEAAQCGLPILYKNSGGIPEYCEGYGLSFDNDFELQLNNMIKNYEDNRDKLKTYPFNSEKMCDDFYALFNKLILSKKVKQNTKTSNLGKIILFKNLITKIFRNFNLSGLKILIKKKLLKNKI